MIHINFGLIIQERYLQCLLYFNPCRFLTDIGLELFNSKIVLKKIGRNTFVTTHKLLIAQCLYCDQNESSNTILIFTTL